MLEINRMNARIWSKLGARGTLGVALLDIAQRDENLIVMTADLSTTSGLDRFKDIYPDKFYNIGIAEQNMINVAAGFGKSGFNVFVTTFANFAALRSFEQIYLSLGYMGSNVKVVGLASGFAMGMFGNTHYGISDLALMRTIPNLVVISPADGAEVVKVVSAASLWDGPMYIRLTGIANNPVVYSEEYNFEIGKAITLKEGKDITIFACGSMVYESIQAAKILNEEGISAAVVNMHTIKPLDTSAIDSAVINSKLIVTVEEHSIIGGLGGAIAEYKSSLKKSPQQLTMGLPDQFGKAGEYKYLLEKCGLTASQIATKILNTLNDIK